VAFVVVVAEVQDINHRPPSAGTLKEQFTKDPVCENGISTGVVAPVILLDQYVDANILPVQVPISAHATNWVIVSGSFTLETSIVTELPMLYHPLVNSFVTIEKTLLLQVEAAIPPSCNEFVTVRLFVGVSAPVNTTPV
jgi:hypothetical protein